MELLKPKIRPICVKGNLYYCESDRGNSIIRLKKEIRNEFIENSKKDIKYQMEYYRTKEEFRLRVDKLMENDKLPFILFLFEGEKS